MTVVELSDEEAELFALFVKNRELLVPLLASKLEDMRGGQVVLHFNAGGVLMQIEKHQTVFRREPVVKSVRVRYGLGVPNP
jgi:hypothetical protein